MNTFIEFLGRYIDLVQLAAGAVIFAAGWLLKRSAFFIKRLRNFQDGFTFAEIFGVILIITSFGMFQGNSLIPGDPSAETGSPPEMEVIEDPSIINIKVRYDRIYVYGLPCESTRNLEERLSLLADDEKTVELTDSYAEESVFEDVVDVIQKTGFTYQIVNE